MTNDRVEAILENYMTNKGRVAHLRIEIPLLEKQLTLLHKESSLLNTVRDGDVLKAQIMTGMPHGVGITDPTAKVAIRFVSGHIPDQADIANYIIEIQGQIQELQDEFGMRNIETGLVEAWLLGLSDKERWVIEQHIFQSMNWRELPAMYKARYGEYYSESSLRGIKRRALKKISKIAS